MSFERRSTKPRPHPAEFHQRAVELAQLREQPLGKIAADLSISESCLPRWVRLVEGGSAGDGAVSTAAPGVTHPAYSTSANALN